LTKDNPINFITD